MAFLVNYLEDVGMEAKQGAGLHAALAAWGLGVPHYSTASGGRIMRIRSIVCKVHNNIKAFRCFEELHHGVDVRCFVWNGSSQGSSHGASSYLCLALPSVVRRFRLSSTLERRTEIGHQFNLVSVDTSTDRLTLRSKSNIEEETLNHILHTNKQVP